MIAFAIITTTDRIRLEGNRTGQASFTVTNISRRNLRARAHVVPDGQTQTGWFAVPNPERPSAVDSTQQFDVQVAVPPEAPAGSYRFRLDVVGVEDPDEYAGQGPWTTVEVPAWPKRRPPPWRWILLAAAAVLVVAVAATVAWTATHRARGELRATADVSDFGTVVVGHASRASIVVVSNPGGSKLRMKAAALSGANAQEFAILADGCKDWDLEAGATCSIQVAFVPKSQGDKQAALRIVAEDLSQTLTFRGTAKA